MANSFLGQAAFLAAYLNRLVLSLRWPLKEVYALVYCLDLRDPLGLKMEEGVIDEPYGPFRILAGTLGPLCCYGEGRLFRVK